MNDRAFDEFVAAVATTSTRRQLFRTCAAAVLASLLGRARRVVSAPGSLPAAQSTDEPLPNFPFMVVLPTDSGFADYGLDVDLTGPPTRFRATDVLPSIPVDWLPIISQCRGAYAATIAKPKADAPHEPQRSVTTILFDLGTTAAATSTHANYVATVLANPLGQRLESTLSKTNRIVFVGCRGGCDGFRSPVASSETPSQEVAVVGRRDRFLFDMRIRDYGTQTITVAQGETVARRVDRHVRTATSAARTRSPLRAFTGGLKVALGGGAAGVRSGSRARAQQSTDDLRATLATANTLPMFGVGADDPPPTATQWLRVDDGAIVVAFDESARSAAARQRDADDAIFAMSLEQPLTVSTPLVDGYDLTLSATQHIFGSEEDGRRFVAETAERIGRGRPQVTLTEADTGQDEQSYTYEDGDSPNGTAYGFLTYAYVTGGPVAAVVAVDLAAVPTRRGRDPLDSTDLQQNLGPLVAQIVTTLSDCLVTPTACPSTAVLATGPTIVPQRTATPGDSQPTATATVCPDDLHDCGDACVDTNSDPDNCGQCGNGCDELMCCSGVCTDVSSDRDNCGECQGVCDAGLVCVDGSCTCTDGADYCDGSCVDLSSDPNNCGECAFVCPSGQVCVDSNCTCPQDSTPCGDSCCGPGLECTDGVCVEPCDPGYLRCNGTCIDPSIDPTNCGACGNACSLPDCCGGQCTDVTSDPGNCGSCGNACSTGEECQYGECYKVPA